MGLTIPYNEQEDEFLRENFTKFGIDYCANFLNRTQNGIKCRASKLGLHLQKPKIKWTEEEIEILKKEILAGKKCKDVAKILGRTTRSVQHVFKFLELEKPRPKIGDKINRLTIIEIYNIYRYNQNITMAKCKCDCGNNYEVKLTNLKQNKIQSCGCFTKEIMSKIRSKLNFKHGLSNTRLFRIWSSIKTRCFDINSPSYMMYGKRNIKIYQEWLDDFMSFYNWAINNGYNEKLSLDRIDVNGNYSPENCRWVTSKEQNNNKRNNTIIEAFGEKKTIAEWFEDYRCKTSYWSILYRINHGWNSELAITTELYKGNPNKENKSYNYNYNRIKKQFHGMVGTRIYKIWSAMKRRCNNPNCYHYENWGGRGIKVCEEWNNNFMNFYYWSMDNGYNDELSIDRIDNNGNYEPSNCRWATTDEQNENKRTKKIQAFGENKTISQWLKDERCSVSCAPTIYNRIKRGFSPEDAISKPLQKHKS